MLKMIRGHAGRVRDAVVLARGGRAAGKAFTEAGLDVLANGLAY